MTTDGERHEVARKLRELERGVIGALIPTGELAENILRAIDYGHSGAITPYGCLANLIEPTDGFDLDTVQRVCFECMEGCDEPEWTLYTTIYSAIARYKRGESGPTYDRQALLELADSLDRMFMTSSDGYIRCELCPAHGLHDICYDLPVSCHDRAIVATARRVHEACGVYDHAC